jgi:hypothetical protein
MDHWRLNWYAENAIQPDLGPDIPRFGMFLQGGTSCRDSRVAESFASNRAGRAGGSPGSGSGVEGKPTL